MAIITNYDEMKTALKNALSNDFAIHTSLQSELKEYKLFYWSIPYLLNNITHVSSKVCLLSTSHGRYYTCNITPQDQEILTALALVDPYKQIAISFRAARNHWNLPAYALIKIPAQKKTAS